MYQRLITQLFWNDVEVVKWRITGRKLEGDNVREGQRVYEYETILRTKEIDTSYYHLPP
jgi:hypothetical protein